MDEVRQVQVEDISISQLNTRKNLNAGTEDTSLDDLAASIRETGLLQPPILRETAPGKYEVVSGQRRILACKQIGLTTVRAVVMDMNDGQALAISLIENVQRADMHPLDKAQAYAGLLSQYGSATEVAKRTGVSARTVSKYLDLLNLTADLLKHLDTGSGPSGISVMSLLAKSFAGRPDEMESAYDTLSGLNATQAEQVLRRAGGDETKVSGLVTQALEGAFNLKMCGTSLETCPHVPEYARSVIRSLVESVGPASN